MYVCIYTPTVCVCVCIYIYVYCRGWQRKRWLITSLTQWTWIWTNSGRYWGTEEPDMLQFMGLQRIRLDWQLNNSIYTYILYAYMCVLSCSVVSDSLRAYELQPPWAFHVHGISQVRILDSVAISFSRGSSQPRDWTHVSWVSCTAGRVCTAEPLGKLHCSLVNMNLFFHKILATW